MGALRPAGNAAGFDHMAKQAQICEVEPHGHLWLWRLLAFEFDEGKLRQKPIVRQNVGYHIRGSRKDRSDPP
jgi:hypothetical protein